MERAAGDIVGPRRRRVTKSLMTSTISVASRILSTVALSIIRYKIMDFEIFCLFLFEYCFCCHA